MTTRLRRHIAFASVFALLGAAACNKASDESAKTALAHSGIALPDGKTPALLVAAMDSGAKAKMEVRNGEVKGADAVSTFIAYVNDGSVRLVDERMTMSDSSTRRVLHYYTSDGHLAANIETRNQIAMSGNSPPVREFVLMSMEFVGDSMTKSTKTVNGEAKPVEKFEADNAKKHAAELAAAALGAPVATPAKP